MTPILALQISPLALAELFPDGTLERPELDLDLDLQDVSLYEPVSKLEIALPGRW